MTLACFSEEEGVIAATRNNFLLQKGEHHNSALIALRDSLDGPQEVHMELVLSMQTYLRCFLLAYLLGLTTNGVFNGKYIANLIVYVSKYRPQPHHKHIHSHKHGHFAI